MVVSLKERIKKEFKTVLSRKQVQFYFVNKYFFTQETKYSVLSGLGIKLFIG